MRHWVRRVLCLAAVISVAVSVTVLWPAGEQHNSGQNSKGVVEVHVPERRLERNHAENKQVVADPTPFREEHANLGVVKIKRKPKEEEEKAAVPVSSLPSVVRSGPPAWPLWQQWFASDQLYPSAPLQSQDMRNLMQDMATRPILAAKVGFRGTQLKMLLTLEGGQVVVFKPKRFDRDFTITGDTFSGFDRHNAEIAGFHLDGLLGFHRAPPVVGRVVNLRTEVLPVAEKKLKDTFYDRGSDVCFYGVCMYCKRELAACAKHGMMEGSVTLWLANSPKLKTWRHPYQRTYKAQRKAPWEVNEQYCQKSVLPQALFHKGPRLLDIMDATVMDYIMGNADRHHYETIAQYGNDGRLLLMDNAKSFGNAYTDDASILAPLRQCCRLRRSTWQLVQEFQAGARDGSSLSKRLEASMRLDPVSPILYHTHLKAVDRRLETLVEAVDSCITHEGEDVVLGAD